MKFFFDQQTESAFGGLGASRVRIEIDHDVFREASQQPGLQLGEGGTRAGDHVVEAGGKDRNAVHLPFDQDGVVQLANRFFRLIEIEQHPRLGVDRGLGRIQIFGSSLLIGRKGAAREGNHAPGFVGDGKHDAVAEFGVHGGNSRWPWLRSGQAETGRWSLA